MTLLLFAALALSAVFGLAAPPVTRRLPPASAVWLLSGGACLAAAASSAALALLAFLSLAPSPLIAAQGHWSDEVLRRHDHAPLAAGACAAVLVAVFAARFVRVAIRRAVALRDSYRLATTLSATELCVLDAQRREAFAVPGRPGRIVTTTGLLRSLDGAERRAVLAHERAHLTHRHHAHQTAVALACAVNPGLRGIGAALSLACERDADEAAARRCPRPVVAAALGRLDDRAPDRSIHRPHLSAVVLAAGSADVTARIDALQSPPVRLQPWRITTLVVLLVAAAVATAVAMHDTEHLFEIAQHAYRAGAR